MKRKPWTSFAVFFAFLILIFDAKTTLRGAKDGVSLCISTVVPSLFPFIFLSIILNSRLLGKNFSPLRPLGRLCGMPSGAESILMLGFLGGYPIGAQCIYQAYHNGELSKNSARRMLGFCNNAGPSFIFGMIGAMFRSPWVAWVLWMIQIVAAIIVGIILPNKEDKLCNLHCSHPLSPSQALKKSLLIMGEICGWVIIFRVIVSFIKRWILWLLPVEYQTIIIGVIELSNGAVELYTHNHVGFQWIVSAGMLSFGGICVAMQTASVTKELGTGMYFPGKILQCTISTLLAYVLQPFILEENQIILPKYIPPIIITSLTIVLICLFCKKIVALRKRMMYNSN